MDLDRWGEIRTLAMGDSKVNTADPESALTERLPAAKSSPSVPAPERDTAKAPRVLVLLNTFSPWSRGVLRGFAAVAQELGWTLLHHHPPSNLDWLRKEWSPAAAVIGPEFPPEAIPDLAPASVVSVEVDYSARRIASVCIDQEAIAGLALDHLLATGLRHLSTFRLADWPFAITRERAFVERARDRRVKVILGWKNDDDRSAPRDEDVAAMLAWLRELPKPCGIFACTDGWGRTLARYARVAGLRVPEDIALVGVDNDVLESALIAPALSSVMIPWYEIGGEAAKLLQLALTGRAIENERLVVPPIAVIARRSSDMLAIDDTLVANAVRWIRAHANERMTVPMVVRAVGGGRQRLERRFRRVLDRTVQEEIRRARVDVAKRLLQTMQDGLPEIAKLSGFTNPALMSAAFQRELGMPPGAYRRLVRQELAGETDG
jgi:LacI family transcriptional regulator